MSSLSGAIPFPATKDGTRGRTRVDHRNSDEAALVRRVQAQDEMAFREIVERYQSKVFSIIFGILRNRNDAEDIAQQVFAKLSLIHISEPTRQAEISYAVFCLKKK